MNNEDKITAGRHAAVMESTVAPIIQDRIPKIIDRMVAMYRSGKLDHDKLVGCVAEIASYYNLVADLENTQRQAILASEKEFGNASKKEKAA